MHGPLKMDDLLFSDHRLFTSLHFNFNYLKNTVCPAQALVAILSQYWRLCIGKLNVHFYVVVTVKMPDKNNAILPLWSPFSMWREIPIINGFSEC